MAIFKAGTTFSKAPSFWGIIQPLVFGGCIDTLFFGSTRIWWLRNDDALGHVSTASRCPRFCFDVTAQNGTLMHCRLACRWKKTPRGKGRVSFLMWKSGPPKLLRDQVWGVQLDWDGYNQTFGFCNSLTWIIQWGVFRSFSYPTMLVQLPVTHKMRSVCDLGVQFHSVYDIFYLQTHAPCAMTNSLVHILQQRSSGQWDLQVCMGFCHGRFPKIEAIINPVLDGGLKYLFFSPTWRNDPIWQAYVFQLGGLISTPKQL